MKNLALTILVLFVGLFAQSQNLIGYYSDEIVQILQDDRNLSRPAFGKTSDNTEYMSFANTKEDNIRLYYLDHDRCFMYEIRTCYENLNKYKALLDEVGTKTKRGSWIIIQYDVHYEAWITAFEKYFTITYVIQTEN